MSLYIGNKKVTPIKVTSGITPSGSIDITENGNYDVTNFATANVNVEGGGDFVGIPREVTEDGVFQVHSAENTFTFTLPSNVKTIGSYGLYHAFDYDYGLVHVDLSNVETLSTSSCMAWAFYYCPNLLSVDLSGLKAIKPLAGSKSSCMESAFASCSKLQSVNLNSLNDIDCMWALRNAFQNCKSLKTLSFPSLNSQSFHLYTDVFSYMIGGVNGCTVHFPSNLQSVIGSWSDVINGFGGINTTVLFDLPATT